MSARTIRGSNTAAFRSARDLDRHRQQRHDQTLAKCQSSPLDGEW